MKNLILKLLASLIILGISNSLYAQKKTAFDRMLNGTGEYIPNNYADNYLGIWQSMDKKYTFKLEKNIVHIKRGAIDFKTDQLITTLINLKVMDKMDTKYLNFKVPFSISQGSAIGIFEDPDNSNPVEIRIYFRDVNKIEMHTKNSMLADKEYSLFFPEKITLQREK